jgi:hypothetical protein
MKLIKGLGLLSFLLIISGSCFDAPEFPVEPQIEFESIQFIAAATPSDFDSLILTIHFKDGNGDLGLNKSVEDNQKPYQSTFFYQGNNGQLEPLIVTPGFIDDEPYNVVEVPNPDNGKLVFFRTRKKPGYEFLPQEFHCADYQHLASKVVPDKPTDGTRLVIHHLSALDTLVELVDSFPSVNPEYYQIKDTLYYTPNPNHFNIEVDWFVEDPTANDPDAPEGYREFDWRRDIAPANPKVCSQNFDGRFPVFSDQESSIDGTLRYSMASFGLKFLFSIKTLKLRITIKDRALHVSNVIETPEFTLLQ